MTPPRHTMAESGCGQRLRAAREKAGLDIDDVATRLKIPARYIQSLEAEEWDRIGAAVFVRGHLRSYSRLLGLPTEPVQAASGVAPIEPTRLVPRTRTPRLQRIADQIGGRLVYIVITALLILPVWWATRSDSLPDAASLEIDLDGSVADAEQGAPSANGEPSTVVASMASLSPRRNAGYQPAGNELVESEPAGSELVLTLQGDSWVQILAPDGRSIEEVLLRAGDSRSYPLEDIGNVVLGNAAAVELSAAGRVRDVSPYVRANVARFTVSSDGSLAPVSD